MQRSQHFQVKLQHTYANYNTNRNSQTDVLTLNVCSTVFKVTAEKQAVTTYVGYVITMTLVKVSDF